MRKYDRKPSLVRYLCISLAVLMMALFIGAVVNHTLSVIYKESTPPEHIIGMLEGIIGAIATGLVLYQLRAAEKTERHQSDIEEASFILQYNQSFIQDEKMVKVERLLEDQVYYDDEVREIITKENRQQFINYLVYLESLAPLIMYGVLKLGHIDNLMAYRFFLAVDNCEVQEKELKPYAEYYRGCYVLYKEWEAHREDRGLRNPIHDCKNKDCMRKLSEWERFDYYSQIVEDMKTHKRKQRRGR